MGAAGAVGAVHACEQHTRAAGMQVAAHPNRMQTAAPCRFASRGLPILDSPFVAPPTPNSHCRAWVQIVGEEATKGMSIACIGSTSARAAEKLGLQRIKVGWLLQPLARPFSCRTQRMALHWGRAAARSWACSERSQAH